MVAETLEPVHEVRSWLPALDYPFENGDEMDQPTFHRLYKIMPRNFRAELIGGVVYYKMPTKYQHGKPHPMLVLWLGTYAYDTPGCGFRTTTTSVLDPMSEPEPDVMLYVCREFGGSVYVDEEDFVTGVPNFITEVANSSLAIDLDRKKVDYQRAGVQEYLFILAKEQRLVWFELLDGLYVEKQTDVDGVLKSTIFPGLWLSPDSLFEEHSAALLGTLREGMATADYRTWRLSLENRRKELSAHRNEKAK